MLPVVAGEILLRGFAFPALAGWKGPVPAALIVSVAVRRPRRRWPGSPALAVLSMLLGLALCALYVATGSLLPGIALASAAAAVALGVACALAPAGVAGARRGLRGRRHGARRPAGPRAGSARPGDRCCAAARREARGGGRCSRRRWPAAAAAARSSSSSAEPPAGAEAAGKQAERQGGADPDAGERIYELRPQEGASAQLTPSPCATRPTRWSP